MLHTEIILKHLEHENNAERNIASSKAYKIQIKSVQ